MCDICFVTHLFSFYNETMKNKNLFYQILISFVLVSVLTNMACLFIRNSVIQQEKLKAEYTVNSTINRVEIKLESYIEKVGFLKKTIADWSLKEAGLVTDKVMSMATEKEVTDYLSDYLSERNKK